MQASKRPGGSAPSGWPRRVPLSLGAGLAVFLALALLVSGGAFTHVDQFAVDHLMPWLRPGARSGSTFSGLVLPFGAGTNAWCIAFDLWNYPCSVLVSGLGVGAVAVLCLRRRRPAAGVVLAATWVAGNAVELLGKHVVVRPALYGHERGHRVEIVPFANSFPSGHMIRGMLLAAAITVALPGARGAVLAWLAPVGPLLVVSSAHTPSDVLGGLIVGGALATAALALAASPALEAWVAGLRAQAAQRRQATVP